MICEYTEEGDLFQILQVGVDTKPAEENNEYVDGSNDDHKSDAQYAEPRSNQNRY